MDLYAPSPVNFRPYFGVKSRFGYEMTSSQGYHLYLKAMSRITGIQTVSLLSNQPELKKRFFHDETENYLFFKAIDKRLYPDGDRFSPQLRSVALTSIGYGLGVQDIKSMLNQCLKDNDIQTKKKKKGSIYNRLLDHLLQPFSYHAGFLEEFLPERLVKASLLSMVSFLTHNVVYWDNYIRDAKNGMPDSTKSLDNKEVRRITEAKAYVDQMGRYLEHFPYNQLFYSHFVDNLDWHSELKLDNYSKLITEALQSTYRGQEMTYPIPEQTGIERLSNLIKTFNEKGPDVFRETYHVPYIKRSRYLAGIRNGNYILLGLMGGQYTKPYNLVHLYQEVAEGLGILSQLFNDLGDFEFNPGSDQIRGKLPVDVCADLQNGVATGPVVELIAHLTPDERATLVEKVTCLSLYRQQSNIENLSQYPALEQEAGDAVQWIQDKVKRTQALDLSLRHILAFSRYLQSIADIIRQEGGSQDQDAAELLTRMAEVSKENRIVQKALRLMGENSLDKYLATVGLVEP